MLLAASRKQPSVVVSISSTRVDPPVKMVWMGGFAAGQFFIVSRL